ncbi:MAG: hypothetical protein E7145_04770 [Rikenellaceae bacterium]|nr:hypothetical protein [Rikenellaceae bacterium]
MDVAARLILRHNLLAFSSFSSGRTLPAHHRPTSPPTHRSIARFAAENPYADNSPYPSKKLSDKSTKNLGNGKVFRPNILLTNYPQNRGFVDNL